MMTTIRSALNSIRIKCETKNIYKESFNKLNIAIRRDHVGRVFVIVNQCGAPEKIYVLGESKAICD